MDVANVQTFAVNMLTENYHAGENTSAALSQQDFQGGRRVQMGKPTKLVSLRGAQRNNILGTLWGFSREPRDTLSRE